MSLLKYGFLENYLPELSDAIFPRVLLFITFLGVLAAIFILYKKQGIRIALACFFIIFAIFGINNEYMNSLLTVIALVLFFCFFFVLLVFIFFRR